MLFEALDLEVISIRLQIEHIQRLTRLFENIRYGNKPSGKQEEQEAIACLTAIVKTYGQPA